MLRRWTYAEEYTQILSTYKLHLLFEEERRHRGEGLEREGGGRGGEWKEGGGKGRT